MSYPAPTVPVYRKTKSGDFAVFGPTDQIKEGPVTVHLKSGATKSTYILSVGNEFDVKGTPCRYGYLTASTYTAPDSTPTAGSKSTSQFNTKVDLDASNFQPDSPTAGADYVPPPHEVDQFTGGHTGEFSDVPAGYE